MDVTAGQAFTAYTTGWAASGGPLTERVQVGCQVAMDLAQARAGTPGVLEATLQLGALEGLWARIYDRRERLYRRHDRAVRAAWHDYTTTALDVPALVAAVRRAAGLTEATPNTPQDQQNRHAAISAAVLAALLALLANPTNTRYLTLVATVETAIRDGVAEGTAGAIAIAAQQAGYTAIDFDTAFTDARAAGAGTDAYQSHAQRWLRRMTEAVARDLAGRLAAMADGGASAAQMATETRSSGTGRNVRAVHLLTDWAIGSAFALGAGALFQGLGIGQINWVTAGDGKVCAACQRNENSNPWPADGAPQPPQHPQCRCITEPAGVIGWASKLARYGRYLIGGARR